MGYTGYTSYIPSAKTSYSDDTSTGDGTGTDSEFSVTTLNKLNLAEGNFR